MPAPSNSHASGYSFEFPVKVPGAESANFIDLYRRAHFVLESKQFAARREELTALERAAIDSGALAAAMKKSGPVRGTGAWDDAMIRAKGQAERYVRSLSAEALDAHRKRVQAQHPDLTLTGLYNVLEKLRAPRSASMANAYSPLPPSASPIPSTAASAHESQASGLTTHTRSEDQALTAKERDIHDRGLVSLLKQLHDDLDAAVFAAYGWPTTLTDAEILDRLVTLNAQRAEEEKRGIIHWLRPEYQSAKGGEQEELALKMKKSVKGSVKGEKLKVKGPKTAKTAWPKPLAERIRATEQVLHAAGTPVTAAELTQAFSRAKPADLQEILESLVTLGRAHQVGEKFSV